MNSRGNTTVARLVCDERTARRVVDSLSDHFDSPATAVAAFEGPDRRWNVELHFETPPDEAAVRALVGRGGGGGACVRSTAVRGGGCSGPQDHEAEGVVRGEPRRPEAGHRRALHGAW